MWQVLTMMIMWCFVFDHSNDSKVLQRVWGFFCWLSISQVVILTQHQRNLSTHSGLKNKLKTGIAPNLFLWTWKLFGMVLLISVASLFNRNANYCGQKIGVLTIANGSEKRSCALSQKNFLVFNLKMVCFGGFWGLNLLLRVVSETHGLLGFIGLRNTYSTQWSWNNGV